MSQIKTAVLDLERRLTRIALVRWMVLLPDFIARRALWAWGRLRFAALARDRGCGCHWNANLKYPENIHLGDSVVIGVNASLGAHSPIHIGNRIRISKEVQIETAGLDLLSGPPPYHHVSKPIVIEDGVWRGTRAMVLRGVCIGAYAVVATGSIVTRDVSPRTIVGGVPVRLLKTLPPLELDMQT